MANNRQNAKVFAYYSNSSHNISEIFNLVVYNSVSKSAIHEALIMFKS